ncbi:hypothetical protein SeLEV6574_g01987 [Synchytrium endobioticum]|uniref:Uncharacterized protein n=1 Tax=Synchytrium endobioticum TaxID=286115 RepID=A0A507DCJ7_9FUNG|nr:hypothetical protein SeLEV6574_g01987 [Synchytrium endobioticum]
MTTPMPSQSGRDIDAVLAVPPFLSQVSPTSASSHHSKSRRRTKSTSDLALLRRRDASETDIDHLLIQADYAPKILLANSQHHQQLPTRHQFNIHPPPLIISRIPATKNIMIRNIPNDSFEYGAELWNSRPPGPKTLLAVRTLRPAYVINIAHVSEDVDELVGIGDVNKSNEVLYDIDEVVAVGTNGNTAWNRNAESPTTPVTRRLRRKAALLRKSHRPRSARYSFMPAPGDLMHEESEELGPATRIVLLDPSQFPPYLSIPIGRAAEDIDQLVTVGFRWHHQHRNLHAPRTVEDIDGLISSANPSSRTVHIGQHSNGRKRSCNNDRSPTTADQPSKSTAITARKPTILRRSTSSPEFPIEWMDVEEIWPNGVTLPDSPRDVDDVLLIAADEEDLHLIVKDGLDVEQVLGLSRHDPFILAKYGHSSFKGPKGKERKSPLPMNYDQHISPPLPSPTSAHANSSLSNVNKNAQRVSYIETDGSQVLRRHKTTIRTTPIIAQNEFGMDIDAVLGQWRKTAHAVPSGVSSFRDESQPRRNSDDDIERNGTSRITGGRKKANWNGTQANKRNVWGSTTNLDIELYVSASRDREQPLVVKVDQLPPRPIPDISEILRLGKGKKVVDASIGETSHSESTNTPRADNSVLRANSNASSAFRPQWSHRPPSQIGGLAGASSESRILGRPRQTVPSGAAKKGKGLQFHKRHHSHDRNAWKSEPELTSPQPLPATDISDMVEWGLKTMINTKQV